MLVLSIAAYAVSMPLAQRPRTQKPQKKTETSTPKQSKPNAIKAQPIIANDDTIPDSLLHSRWKIQKTTPLSEQDLSKNAMDLNAPANVKPTITYNDTSLEQPLKTSKIHLFPFVIEKQLSSISKRKSI